MAHLPPERLRFLRDLLRAHGPSGHEGPAAEVWRAEAATFARVDHDVLGSSFAEVGPADGPSVLLLGHIDEIGLIVSHIEDSDASYDGKLRVRPLGGWDPEVLVGQHVELRSADGRLIPGVVGKLPIHLAPKDGPTRSSMETLWVDIGARDADDARTLVAVGDTAVLVGEARELANGQLAGKALDNRTGAWIVLEAARRVAERGGGSVPVVACACAIEETLGDGARAAAHRVDPKISIVVDVTHASDVPGGLLGTTGVQVPGRGPTITRGLGLNHKLTAELERVGAEASITVQPEALSGGSSTYTDVDGALRALAGSAIGLVSIPLRHMHSPAEVCALSDLDQAAELIARFCLSLQGDEDWR
jgi:endoglucanase